MSTPADLLESGVDYCRLHHGIRNEDDHWCDMRDEGDPEQTCTTCGGSGVNEAAVGDEDGWCPDCEEGITRCDLTPLLYEAAPAASSPSPLNPDTGGPQT